MDIAELPTVEEMRSLDANGDGQITAAEKSAYLARKGADLTARLSLRINGHAAPLTGAAADLQIRPGAAGLPILLVILEYHVPLDRGAGRLVVKYDDENFPARTGWREVIASARGGWKIDQSDVPARGVSNGLANYPVDLIAAPPQVTSATIVIEPGNYAVDADPFAGSGTASATASTTAPRDHFTQLITAPRISVGFLIIALGVSFALGAAHAMAPGHGKTVVAAYLVSSRGTARHALLLGGVVTATHVAGIFLLGIVVLMLSKYVVPERLYPWLSFASGMTIFIVGVQQFVLRSAVLRGDRAAADHDPGRGEHTHALPQGISLTDLVAMGISGGMVPCPSALLVLLGAIALGRTELGLVLIVAFSIGLATVLVSLGLAAVHARQFLGRFEWRSSTSLMRRLPLFSSAAVALIGLGIAVQALLSAAGISRL